MHMHQIIVLFGRRTFPPGTQFKTNLLPKVSSILNKPCIHHANTLKYWGGVLETSFHTTFLIHFTHYCRMHTDCLSSRISIYKHHLTSQQSIFFSYHKWSFYFTEIVQCKSVLKSLKRNKPS